MGWINIPQKDGCDIFIVLPVFTFKNVVNNIAMIISEHIQLQYLGG